MSRGGSFTHSLQSMSLQQGQTRILGAQPDSFDAATRHIVSTRHSWRWTPNQRAQSFLMISDWFGSSMIIQSSCNDCNVDQADGIAQGS